MERCLVVATISLVAALGAHPPSAAAPYLGQRPPGVAPRVFAPGAISTGNIHSRLSISPDGREMFWSTVDTTTFSTRLLTVRDVGGRWTEPQRPPFGGEGSLQSPIFAPYGKRLYFQVLTDAGWVTRFVEKLASGWSAPRGDGALLRTGSSFTRSGRVYFSSAMENKVWGSGIFSARYSSDGYSDIAPLDSTINVPGGIDYTPYISPDESFLLFSSNRPSVGEREDMHVFVSFRGARGAWSAPRRVFDIPGRFPSLSPDGRFLFFCGDDGNFYWADAKIVDRLRPPGDEARR